MISLPKISRFFLNLCIPFSKDLSLRIVVQVEEAGSLAESDGLPPNCEYPRVRMATGGRVIPPFLR